MRGRASPRRGPLRQALSSFLLFVAVVPLAACGDSSSAPAARATAPATPAATPRPGTASQDWPRFGYDPARTSVNPAENTITAGNVANLRRLWQVALPATADSSPIYLSGLRFPDGSTHDTVFIETRTGTILALDAATGKRLWSTSVSGVRYTNSSPVADPSRAYIYAYGTDSYLHRFQATTGAEVKGNGWPVRITTMPNTEKESSPLNIANGRVYVTTAGYPGDAPPYQGHVVAVDTTSGAVTVFNSLCSDKSRVLNVGDCGQNQSGIWARGGAVVEPGTGNVYVTTGNGNFNGRTDWGDSVIKLSPDLTRVLDSYTPTNEQVLDTTDADLGSTTAALLPEITGSRVPRVLIQGGKDQKLRLINRDDMSGQGGPGYKGGEPAIMDWPGCQLFTQPVSWQERDGTIWVVIAGTCGMVGYTVRVDAQRMPRLRQEWSHGIRFGTPTLTGEVLFAATSGTLIAYDPRTGKQLWSSKDAGAGGTIGDIHWESQIVAGGRVYIPDENGTLTAYGL